MPTDPESQRTTTPRHGDTDASLAVHLAEINRLQLQRDALADLVRVAIGWIDSDSPSASEDELTARLNAILRGGA